MDSATIQEFLGEVEPFHHHTKKRGRIGLLGHRDVTAEVKHRCRTLATCPGARGAAGAALGRAGERPGGVARRGGRWRWKPMARGPWCEPKTWSRGVRVLELNVERFLGPSLSFSLFGAKGDGVVLSSSIGPPANRQLQSCSGEKVRVFVAVTGPACGKTGPALHGLRYHPVWRLSCQGFFIL